MNIVEAYIKFHNQMLIFISGLTGSGKTELAKNISRDFKFKHINQFDYYKKDYSEEVALENGEKIVNWCVDSSIDWDKLNADIEKMKGEGLVVVGIALHDKITHTPDYHIHLNISKKNYITNRKEFLEKNKEKYPEDYKLLGTETDILKFTKLIYPYYEETTRRSSINKFLNANNLNNDEIYNSAFDLIIDQIQRKLKQGKYSEKDESQHLETTHNTQINLIPSSNSNHSSHSSHSSHTSSYITNQKLSHKSNKKDSHTSNQKSFSKRKSDKLPPCTKGKKTLKAELELLNQPEYLTQSTINYLAT